MAIKREAKPTLVEYQSYRRDSSMRTHWERVSVHKDFTLSFSFDFNLDYVKDNELNIMKELGELSGWSRSINLETLLNEFLKLKEK